MDQSPTPLKKIWRRIWRFVPFLATFALAIYLLVPQFDTLVHSWYVVENLTWWAVWLAAGCEIISWLGNGIVLSSILKIQNQKLSIWKGAIIAVATLSVSIAGGGWVGLAMMVSWIHYENEDRNTAMMAGILPSFLNTGALVLFSLIGTAYLLFVHILSKAELVEFSLIFFVLGAFSAFVFWALSSAKILSKIAVWLTSKWAAIRHKPNEPEKTITVVENFVSVWNSLGKGRWLRPLLGAIVNVLFDMFALFFMFISAGHELTLGRLFAGYSLPLILGKAAFFLPGGVGVVENSMVALFVNVGVPESIAAVAVLGFRFISLWMVVIIGFAFTAYLSGRLVVKKQKKD